MTLALFYHVILYCSPTFGDNSVRSHSSSSWVTNTHIFYTVKTTENHCLDMTWSGNHSFKTVIAYLHLSIYYPCKKRAWTAAVWCAHMEHAPCSNHFRNLSQFFVAFRFPCRFFFSVSLSLPYGSHNCPPYQQLISIFRIISSPVLKRQ
jgi:hypothetical protein